MINDLKNTLVNMEMSLDELVFERLDMSYEDLLYDLHNRLVERQVYFDDIERTLSADTYDEESDADSVDDRYDTQYEFNFEDEE